MKTAIFASALVLGSFGLAQAEICMNYGPQTPRDISVKAGANTQLFALAQPSTEMNLCNIHSHTNAEHRGPGFQVFAGDGVYGGYQCNETADLTEAELAMPETDLFYGQVKPGDTIEVHWVHTSCQVSPGPGLGSCLSDSCANPSLRAKPRSSWWLTMTARSTSPPSITKGTC